MICKYCNSIEDEASNFCSNWGEKLTKAIKLPSDPEPIMIYENFSSYRVINPNTLEENE